MPVHVDLHFLSRTIRIGWLKNAGTAIYFEQSNRRFLVTAAHLMKGASVGDRIMVRHKGTWTPVEISAISFAPDDIDVCVIVPATQWGEGLPTDLLSGEVIMGEDVAFCGFPLGLEMEGIPDSRGWPTALLKSGTFSGAIKINGQTTYLFDASANVGFSGGPILRKSSKDGKLSIVGIVSGYKYDTPQNILVKDEQGEAHSSPTHYVLPNSGFMYGVPSFHAKEVINDLFS